MDGNSDAPLDDAMLLQDRVLRSLHRSPDGHLAASRKAHKESVLDTHNVATLYVYTKEDDGYTMHEHYVFSHQPLQYKEWLEVVIKECFQLEANKSEIFYGVYGWLTGHLRITPMRNGDLFIKIDAEGAKGVRLTFDPRKNSRRAHNEKKSKTKRG